MAQVISTDTADIVVNKLSRDIFNQLSAAGQLISTEIYFVEDENIDVNSKKIQNLADPESNQDAATKAYVDAKARSGTITGIKMNGVVVGRSGIVDLSTVLSAHQSLTAYATTATLTSTYATKAALTSLQTTVTNKIKQGDYGSTLANVDQLSIVNISEDDYGELLYDEKTATGAFYIVSAENFNVYNERIVNVAAPQLSSDAATKAYVDAKGSGTGTLSSITINSVTKEGTNGNVNLGTVLTAHQSLTAYETKADLTSNYYKKSDTTLNSSGVIKIGTTQITALTAHQSLDGYALTSQIPTKTSQLTNDSNFLTAHQSLTAYETKADLTSNYYTKTEVDAKDSMPIEAVTTTSFTPAIDTYSTIAASVASAASSFTMTMPTLSDSTKSVGFEVRIDGSSCSSDKQCSFSGTVVSMDDDAGVISAGKKSYVTGVWNGTEWEIFWRNV